MNSKRSAARKWTFFFSKSLPPQSWRPLTANDLAMRLEAKASDPSATQVQELQFFQVLLGQDSMATVCRDQGRQHRKILAGSYSVLGASAYGLRSNHSPGTYSRPESIAVTWWSDAIRDSGAGTLKVGQPELVCLEAGS